MVDTRQDKRTADSDLTGFGAVFTSIHDGLGNYLQASDDAVEVIGVPAGSLVGQSAADFVIEEDMPIVAEAFEVAWTRRIPVRLMIRFQITGEPRWVHVRFQLVKRDGRDEFVSHARRTEPPPSGRASFSVDEAD